MAAAWLYKVDSKGVFVTPDFMARLRAGDPAALRSLNQQALTVLYRRGFTRESRRSDAEGLFWSSTPPLELIPFVHGGRHSPPAWVRDSLLAATASPRRNTYYPPKMVERAVRNVVAHAKFARKRMKAGEQAVMLKVKDNEAEAWEMKPNLKFDLVVVNRHDRAALLKLLGELDGVANIGGWLAGRTLQEGATAPSVLYADYVAWCERESEAAAGMKGFAQALVAAGVAKLPRSAGGVRYELQLR